MIKTTTSFQDLFFISITATNDQVIQPTAPIVSVSFKIPEPQKMTDGINNIASAIFFVAYGYFFWTALYIAHNPEKLNKAKNKEDAE